MNNKYMGKRSLIMFLIVFMFCICPLSVKAADIQLNKTKLTMSVGSSFQLKLENNTKKTEWSASNKRVTVTQKGKVTAQKAGKATVTVKAGKETYSCKITVVDDGEAATLDLVMKVHYKGSPIRVNAVYYITLFKDRTLKNRLAVVPLNFKNASEVTRTLKVKLSSVISAKYKLYITETDKKGVPIIPGKKSGYQIRINGEKKNFGSVTLSRGNLVERIKILNTLLGLSQ